jgi:hypothetical protein
MKEAKSWAAGLHWWAIAEGSMVQGQMQQGWGCLASGHTAACGAGNNFCKPYD